MGITRMAPVPNHTQDGETPKSIAGTFTVAGKTKHVTIRFKESEWAVKEVGLPEGAMVVEYLRGPDNESDFTAFGFAIPSPGNGHEVRIWRKFNTTGMKDVIWSAQYLARLDRERLLDAGYQYALRSGRCSRCGRTLTVPASINRGLGPECAKRV